MIVVDVSTVKQHDCELAFSRSRLGPSPVLVQYLRGKTTAVLCQHASGGNVVDGRNFVTSRSWLGLGKVSMDVLKQSSQTHEEFTHSSSRNSIKQENGGTNGILFMNTEKDKTNASLLSERINSAERPKHDSTEHLLKLEERPRRSPENDVEQFDTAMLKGLSFTKSISERGEITIGPANTEDSLILRSLRRSDYDLDYIELLSQLTVVGTVTQEMFQKRFDSMKCAEGGYYTMVIEEKLPKRRIVGTVTLVIEQKFIRATALRGRIEDVVVHHDRRGENLGKLLLKVATSLSKTLGCYKVSLECKDRLVDFYSQFGYQIDPGNNYMTQRFHE